jgi:hypothetical protein
MAQLCVQDGVWTDRVVIDCGVELGESFVGGNSRGLGLVA